MAKRMRASFFNTANTETHGKHEDGREGQGGNNEAETGAVSIVGWHRLVSTWMENVPVERQKL